METTDPEGLHPLTVEVISLFEAPLGRFVMATAQLDMTLNFLMYETHPLVAELQLAKGPPRMLGDKITLLAKVFAQHQKLAPISTGASNMLREADRLNALRSYVVHGALSGHIPGPTPALYFVKADYAKAHKSFQKSSRLVAHDELVNEACAVTVAAKGLDDIVRLLRSARAPALAGQ